MPRHAAAAVAPNLYVWGDHGGHASIEGGMASGRNAEPIRSRRNLERIDSYSQIPFALPNAQEVPIWEVSEGALGESRGTRTKVGCGVYLQKRQLDD